MPANLTPQYHDAEERFKAASTDQERVDALEEMLRVIPKHKGTEKLQADLKRRLSKVRKQAQKKAPGAGPHFLHQVPKEGAGQVVLAGPPNSGKSKLLARLTNAQPEVADYPFTTREPLPGMMPFEDIQIQLVDTVPLAPETSEPWQLAMIENADLVLLLFDASDPDILEQTEFVLDIFGKRGIEISREAAPAIVVLGNKADRPQGRDDFEAWQGLYGERVPAIPFSALSEGDLMDLKGRLFRMLDVVRVYTKAPGHKTEADTAPYVLPRGATIMDAAAMVHKDLVENFKFARVWNEHGLQGMMVERSYEMQDRDLVEIHE